MAWFRLLYPHPAVVVCSLKLARLWPAARTHRDRALEAPPRNCRYGRDIGIPVRWRWVWVVVVCGVVWGLAAAAPAFCLSSLAQSSPAPTAARPPPRRLNNLNLHPFILNSL
jgi:hypothetical protein